MDKKKHRKKKGLLSSRFYRIYFAVVAVAVVAIAIGLMWLRGAVADYEGYSRDDGAHGRGGAV